MLLRDGRVLIAGGSGPAGPSGVASAELYDPKTGVFSPTGSMNAPRRGGTATLLSDGRVLVSGIAKAKQVPGIDTSVDLFDPATGTFTPTGPMITARLYATATLLPDGRVLVAGGENDSGSLASAELYDSATGKFSPTGSMVTAGGGTATLLPDGRVLIAGGFDDSGPVASAELYDPKTGKFSPTGSMTTVRDGGYTATLLSDGRVLIAGGSHGSCGPGECPGIASAEVYDPKTGRFSPTGSMTGSRWLGTATLLPDGQVLITGGNPGSGDLASAELFDPATGKFSPTGSMVAGRSAHTATLLPDGRVLIAGGNTATAELFQP
jgi:hypothetical protein